MKRVGITYIKAVCGAIENDLEKTCVSHLSLRWCREIIKQELWRRTSHVRRYTIRQHLSADRGLIQSARGHRELTAVNGFAEPAPVCVSHRLLWGWQLQSIRQVPPREGRWLDWKMMSAYYQGGIKESANVYRENAVKAVCSVTDDKGRQYGITR